VADHRHPQGYLPFEMNSFKRVAFSITSFSVKYSGYSGSGGIGLLCSSACEHFQFQISEIDDLAV